MSNRSPVTTEDGVPSGSATPLTPGTLVPGLAPYYNIAPGIVLPAPHATSHAAAGTDPIRGPLALQAGTAAPNTAPIKLTSGVLLTAPEVGAIEFLADKFHGTITTGTARKEFALADVALTAGRIPFTTTDGRLADSADLTRNATTGALAVTAPTGTALTVTSTNGVGELALKIRTAAATSAAAQAGVDYGFNNSYRITQAVAGAGIGAPFGGSAYTYCAGVPYRFITDNVLNGIEFWAGSIYAARVYQGTVQCGAVPSGGSATGIPLYCGKSAATVQLRVGDLSGNCWSIGRDNVSSGDLIIEPTVPAGTTPFASALRVSGATGVCRATFGQQIGASGTTITQTKVHTPSLTPASVSAGAGVEQTFAVSGLTTGDTVTVNAPAGAVFSARVTAANTLGLTFMPPASGSYTPPAGTYRVLAIRS